MGNDYLKYIKLSSISFWVSKKGVIGSIIIGVIFARLLISLDIIPSVPSDPNRTTTQWWNIIAIVSCIFLAVIFWIIATQFYLRKGRGYKIGLAYDGYAVKRDEWNRTQNILRDLFTDGKIKNQVSLRFVPVRTTKIDHYANKYIKRYGFSILVAIQHSPHIKENNLKHDQQTFYPEISLILTGAIEKEFIKTTFKQTIEIFSQRTKTIETVYDVLKARAHTLYDMMLRITAALCYRDGKYIECSEILRHLDQSLSSIMGPLEEPRFHIRWFCALSYIRPTEFSHKNIPPYDELLNIHQFVEKAIDFFDDFSPVVIAISRMRFLIGDFQGTVEITNRYKGKIDTLQKAGIKLKPKVLVEYYLNFGFISFIQHHWVNSYNSYCKMLSFSEYQGENWEGIVEFIDYVETLDRYEGIFYLQTLYRLIGNKSVPTKLLTSAQNWVNQDDSRRELRNLLANIYPPGSNKTIFQSKKQNKKRNRKKKPRKNR